MLQTKAYECGPAGPRKRPNPASPASFAKSQLTDSSRNQQLESLSVVEANIDFDMSYSQYYAY